MAIKNIGAEFADSTPEYYHKEDCLGDDAKLQLFSDNQQENSDNSKLFPNSSIMSEDELFNEILLDDERAEREKADRKREEHRKELSKHLPIYGFKNKSFVSYLANIVDVKNCSQDMLLATALAAVGVAFRGSLYDGIFKNGLRFYYCAIAGHSDTKTEGTAELTQALWDIDKSIFEQFQKQEEEFVKNKEKNVEPIYNPLIITQSTWEARTSALNCNPHGLLNDGDEASAFLKRLNSYHSDGEVEELNGLWSKGRAKVIRSTQRPKFIHDACFSIVCNIQAKMLKKVFANEDWAANGFLFRWMFTVQDERIYNRCDGKRIDAELQKDWKFLIDRIYYSAPRTLLINGEAYKVYADWKNECEERCKKADEKGDERNSHLIGVLRKLEIIVERVAACIHLINREDSNDISKETMQFAIDMMPYFERTQMEVYDLMHKEDSYKITTKELIRYLDKEFKITERNKRVALAEVLGRDKSLITKYLS